MGGAYVAISAAFTVRAAQGAITMTSTLTTDQARPEVLVRIPASLCLDGGWAGAAGGPFARAGGR